MLAGLQRGDRDLLVVEPGARDIDEADVIAVDQRVVVGFVALPAELLGRFLDGGLVAAGDGDHPRFRVDIEEPRDLAVGVGVSPTHELVADKADTDLGHVGSPFAVLRAGTRPAPTRWVWRAGKGLRCG